MVSLMTVYDAFLSKVGEDDWTRCYSKEDLEWFIKDWREFLNSAIPYFKFPRCSLEINEETQEFVDENISQDEIQVLSVYMKQEWLKRTIDTWENIKTQYDEADFAQAHLLDTFLKLREAAKDEAKEIEAIYYRSRKKKPYKYSRLIGGNKQNRRRFR